MTSKSASKQRPTVLEAAKQMGILGWGLVIILSASFTSSAVRGDAPWWLVPLVFFGFTLFLIAAIRYPEARPISMDQRLSNTAQKRNGELAAALQDSIFDMQRAGEQLVGIPTATSVQDHLSAAINRAQTVLDNKSTAL